MNKLVNLNFNQKSLSKSLKENNEDKKARTAMGLSILALGLILVAFLIYGVFISDGAFKVVTFS